MRRSIQIGIVVGILALVSTAFMMRSSYKPALVGRWFSTRLNEVGCKSISKLVFERLGISIDEEWQAAVAASRGREHVLVSCITGNTIVHIGVTSTDRDRATVLRDDFVKLFSEIERMEKAAGGFFSSNSLTTISQRIITNLDKPSQCQSSAKLALEDSGASQVRDFDGAVSGIYQGGVTAMAKCIDHGRQISLVTSAPYSADSYSALNKAGDSLENILKDAAPSIQDQFKSRIVLASNTIYGKFGVALCRAAIANEAKASGVRILTVGTTSFYEKDGVQFAITCSLEGNSLFVSAAAVDDKEGSASRQLTEFSSALRQRLPQ